MSFIPQAAEAPAFTLTVAGHDIVRKLPLNEGTFHVTGIGAEDTGIMEARIFDPFDLFAANGLASKTILQPGAEVLFTRVSNGHRMWGGTTIAVSMEPHPGGGRIYDMTAVDFNSWLDWRIAANRVYPQTPGGTMTDRNIVLSLITTDGGRLTASNATVEQTRLNVPRTVIKGKTLRQALELIADEAFDSDDTNSRPRRFYVDFERRLHWYQDTEGTFAPYDLTDRTYTTRVLATSGLVSLWSMGEASGATAYDAKADVNHLTLTGGYGRGLANAFANEPQYTSTIFNGSTAYGEADDADLHQGDGPWAFECWFRRNGTGANSAIWSGGNNDVEIGFNIANNLTVTKQGTGDHFVSNASYSDTSIWRHLVVSRASGANVNVYVNGASVSGTHTSRTFASAASNTVNVGRRKTDNDRYFAGHLQHVAWYSSVVSAATALEHYTTGTSIVPDFVRAEYDGTDIKTKVYVQQAKNSGYVVATDIGIPLESAFGGAARDDIEGFRAYDEGEGVPRRRQRGAAYLRRHGGLVKALTFTVTGYDGWSSGQLVRITSDALGLDAAQYEVREVELSANIGSGAFTYEVDAGSLRRRLTRDTERKSRRNR